MLDRYIKTKVFTYTYYMLLFVYAVFLIMIGWESYELGSPYVGNVDVVIVNDSMYRGLQGLVLFASVALIVSSRLSDAMLPVLMFAINATACYNSSAMFLSLDFLWVAPFAVFALVFHFIKYRASFKVGKSFWGICAISIALLLGGIGSISASDYFSGTSLFYMCGLGIGMLFFYLLIKSQMGEEEKQNVARVMYLAGILAAFSVFWLYMSNWEISIGAGSLLKPQFANNLSTFIMMALPFTIFYPSRKRRYLDFFAFFFMYAMIAISGSRGGLVFGGIEVVILLTVYCFIYKKGRASVLPRSLFLVGMALLCAGVWFFLPEMVVSLRLGTGESTSRISILKELFASVFSAKESRMGMLGRMVSDFKENPIFGAGLGNTGNTDLYSPVKGAMVWYHMWLPQIVGSLGLVGIAAYGYQLCARVRIYFQNPGFTNRTFFLSYIGLLLMSQVNPGEFCPVPYAMLAVTCFALIESPEEDILLTDLFKKGKSFFRRGGKRCDASEINCESQK